MIITLAPASERDAAKIHTLQVIAFLPLLEKYEDYDTSPANEPLEKTINRLKNPDNTYFMIMADDELAGAIRIVRTEPRGSLWISPLFIAPEFQGKTIAQQAMILAEREFKNDKVWELCTLAEEKGNCHLYEKLGYKKTGRSEEINSHTTLVYYKKERE